MSIKFAGKEVSSIVFDFDGTLYSHEELQDKIWEEPRKKIVRKIFENRGVKDFTPDEFNQLLEDYIGRAKKVGWDRAFLDLGGDINDYYEITGAASKAEFLEYDEQLVLLLTDIIKQVPIYIFTGSNREIVLKALEVLIGDLWLYFEKSMLAFDDMKIGRKPNENAYQEMIDVFGVDPDKTVFVDDQRVEVDSATSFGMITFLVREESKEMMMGPHVVLKSIFQLTDHLEIIA